MVHLLLILKIFTEIFSTSAAFVANFGLKLTCSDLISHFFLNLMIGFSPMHLIKPLVLLSTLSTDTKTTHLYTFNYQYSL